MNDKYKEGLQRQLDTLAERLNCKLIQRPGIPGMMFVEFGYVEGPTIQTQSDYMVCLHELGHYAWGHTQGRPPKRGEDFYFRNGVLRSEAQAWEYALNTSLLELEPATRRFMWDACLGSYYFHYKYNAGRPTRLCNGDRHHVEFVFDKPDAYFTSIVRRIQGNLSRFRIQYTD